MISATHPGLRRHGLWQTEDIRVPTNAHVMLFTVTQRVACNQNFGIFSFLRESIEHEALISGTNVHKWCGIHSGAAWYEPNKCGDCGTYYRGFRCLSLSLANRCYSCSVGREKYPGYCTDRRRKTLPFWIPMLFEKETMLIIISPLTSLAIQHAAKITTLGIPSIAFNSDTNNPTVTKVIT
jgi:hypothetical protein